jgi:hypothetical protein
MQCSTCGSETVPFDYYDSLSSREKATYRRSDRVTEVRLADPARLRSLVGEVRAALGTEKTRPVQVAMARLCAALTADLGAAPVRIKVLARRPTTGGEELHGIYEREEGEQPLITVWMRTAAKRRVVTFRTFLRTFLHELCHHLDYELMGLSDTFHTEGFFKRESSLMRALAPPREKKPPAGGARPAAAMEEAAEAGSADPPSRPGGQVQLTLFDD